MLPAIAKVILINKPFPQSQLEFPELLASITTGAATVTKFNCVNAKQMKMIIVPIENQLDNHGRIVNCTIASDQDGRHICGLMPMIWILNW